jgi:hypothetical protein
MSRDILNWQHGMGNATGQKSTQAPATNEAPGPCPNKFATVRDSSWIGNASGPFERLPDNRSVSSQLDLMLCELFTGSGEHSFSTSPETLANRDLNRPQPFSSGGN